MTQALFREDAYLKSCEATVVAVNDRGGIVVDQTVFYPTGGGQPGDTGVLTRADGRELAIATTVKGETVDEIVHVPADTDNLPAPGEKITLTIDWEKRHRLMRMHTALHILSAVLPYPVTGGQVSDGKGRLDFDLPEATLDKDDITARLNGIISGGHDVAGRWISDEALAAQPDLVKTMSVKPPTGAGQVRLIEVAGHDLQPCGGTHIGNTAEIGAIYVRKIEKKGRQNRRVNLAFMEQEQH